ncbi:MAG: hypothetical protein V4586_09175 [Pseudomonadota bacterium]
MRLSKAGLALGKVAGGGLGALLGATWIVANGWGLRLSQARG